MGETVLTTWLYMSGYGWYVWGSYGLVLLALGGVHTVIRVWERTWWRSVASEIIPVNADRAP